MDEPANILLTGVTGFLGSHLAALALERGYTVRGSMRDLGRADTIRRAIARVAPTERLTFVAADLSDAAAWDKAAAGMDFVLHVASPFPTTIPKNEEAVIRPAVDGTLNVLRAASKHGVKRVVLTSSSGAAMYGVRRKGTFTEEDWTDVTNKQDTSPYFRSKTMAERAAWEFISADDSGMELTTVLPGAILGPLLENDPGTSAAIVLKLLDGSVPALPNIGFAMVDVRSVADLHLRAMENPAAAGERFLGAGKFFTFKEVAEVLRRTYPERKFPSFVLPHFAVRLFRYVDPTLGPILVDLGAKRKADHAKATRVLGWSPLSMEQSIRDCAMDRGDHPRTRVAFA
ncbi:MAG: aldehyde reductase [Bacteroidota bacterium]